jgi:hypothetical protein
MATFVKPIAPSEILRVAIRGEGSAIPFIAELAVDGLWNSSYSISQQASVAIAEEHSLCRYRERVDLLKTK